ncbi:MAG: tetratricopeptide repeat protein [Candidatus Eisenbacteria bacterium]|uniref:Tetratricopeptide repeat protein n=1 Tax=Eiseniibacteriota bacterium TaxID=2212470 RepID=A0A538U8Z0_UNCEI|nr:MAG: tetratricopeptide repeat protein [Candidatus Eisenbacteria bacterium]
MWRSVGVAISLFVSAQATGRDQDHSQYSSEEALRRYAQGRLLEEQGVRNQALDEYYRALSLDPTARDVARRVSEVAAQMGDPGRSLEFAERALATDPTDARARWLKGAALLNLGKDADALAMLQSAVERDSDRIEYVRTLARAAEQLDRFDLVAKSYRRAVWLDDEDGEAWFQLAAAEARQGHFGLFFLRGWIAEARGRPEEAEKDYRQHLQAHRDDETARRRLTAVLARDKKYREALEETRILARAHPRDLELRHLEADLAFEGGTPAEGMQSLDRLRADFPDDPEALNVRLAVLAQHGRAKQAVTEAERCLSDHPNDMRALLLAARSRELSGDTAGEIAHLRRALEAAPDSLAPPVLLARVYQQSGRASDAEPLLAKAHARFPDVPAVAFDLSQCREKLGDFAGAEAAARDVLNREPDNATALNFLGYLFADHNRKVNEAVALIRRALAQEPDNGAFLDSLGWAYYRLGRLAEARSQLERAVAVSGGDPVIHEHLGDVYKDMKLKELARDQYQKSLSFDRANERVRAKLSSLR